MSATLPLGTRLGRYEIHSKIGEGGMGEVYLALDTELGRKVAIKILPSNVAANQDRMRRFTQEAKAAAALTHSNIAHIYEIGQSGGIHFIAMEYVEGETLRKTFARGNNDLKILLKHLFEVAQGLVKAHAAGIVHRDLKPDNIMITRDGQAKILDFGLAKLIETRPETGTNVAEAATVKLPIQQSKSGVVMGTVGYMSPEQAQAKPVDQRSDIFSFGCVLYEAATGRQPFVGDSVVDSVHKMIYEPAPAITDFNPAASPDLQRIIRKCLAKEPEKRYQTIRDTANDLEEILEEMKGARDSDRSVTRSGNATTNGVLTTDESLLASESTSPLKRQPSSNGAHIISGIKQHKLIAAVAVLLVAAGVALAVFLHARNTEVAIESVAVLPFQNRSTDADTEYLSEGLAESLIYRLSQLPNLRVSPTSSVFRYSGKQSDPIKVGEELGVNAVVSGRVVQRGDNLTISAELVDVRYNKVVWGEQYDRKMSDLLSTQREIAREIVEQLKLKVSGQQQGLAKHYTESNEAYQLYLKGRFYWNKRQPEAIRKSIEYFTQAIETDPNFALAYAGLADSYVVPANKLPPKEAMPKAKAAAMRALQLDETLAEAHTSLARVMATYDWNWPDAQKEYKRAIELTPSYAVAHEWYGGWFEAMGRNDESIAERKRAVELDPLSPIINFEMGLAYYYGRDNDRAITQFQKVLDLDPGFPPVKQFLPAAFEQKGMYDKAFAGFQNVIAEKGGSEWTFALAGLGHLYATAGKKGEALEAAEELKHLSLQQYVPAPSIALIYAGLGEKEQAFAWLEKGYEQRAFQMIWLKADPRWDSLRSDPHFNDLLRRMGLQ